MFGVSVEAMLIEADERGRDRGEARATRVVRACIERLIEMQERRAAGVTARDVPCGVRRPRHATGDVPRRRALDACRAEISVAGPQAGSGSAVRAPLPAIRPWRGRSSRSRPGVRRGSVSASASATSGSTAISSNTACRPCASAEQPEQRRADPPRPIERPIVTPGRDAEPARQVLLAHHDRDREGGDRRRAGERREHDRERRPGEQEADDQRRDSDHRAEQHRAPAEAVGQRAADQRADGAAEQHRASAPRCRAPCPCAGR